MRTSAKVWPIRYFILEEIKARNWTVQNVIDMIDDPITKLAFRFLFMKPIRGMIIGEEVAKELSRIFATSKEYWINLDKAWQEYSRGN